MLKIMKNEYFTNCFYLVHGIDLKISWCKKYGSLWHGIFIGYVKMSLLSHFFPISLSLKLHLCCKKNERYCFDSTIFGFKVAWYGSVFFILTMNHNVKGITTRNNGLFE
jgi:hypothetical protein